MMSSPAFTDDFMNGLVIGAGCAAFGLVGLSESELNLALHNTKHVIVTQFAGFGEHASTIADAFATAVIGCKTALEAARTEGIPQ